MEIFDRLAIGDQLMRLQWKDHEEGLRKFYSFYTVGFYCAQIVDAQPRSIIIIVHFHLLLTYSRADERRGRGRRVPRGSAGQPKQRYAMIKSLFFFV